MKKIRLRYVKAYRDRHRVWRFYFRRKGQKPIALPSDPDSKQFHDAYNAALNGAVVPTLSDPGANGRTVAALFVRYRASPAWPKNESTQRTYRQAMKPIEAQDGHRIAVDLPADKAAKIIEEIGETRPGMANLTRSVMRAAFDYAIKLKWRYDNPFSGIASYEIGTRHTWTDDQIEKFIKRWPLGTRERMAFDLCYYTAQRVSDVAKAKRSDIKGDKLFVKQKKTGTELLIPIHPGLRASMNAYGIHGPNLIARLDGKPLSIKMLQVVLNEAIDKAKLPNECVPHGIRKAVLRTLAELDVSTKGIASLSGHKTLKEIERYTEAADQGRMAITAIAALPDRTR